MTEWGRALSLGCTIAWPLFLLSACADTHGESIVHRTPPGSTETGNPPVIDVTRVALVVTSDELHVTGEDGAVKPGGSELEIETVSSGDVARGKSDAKGAFDIQVDGTIDDTYQLRALGESKDVKSAPVYLYRGGASVGEGDGGMFSCEQRASVIEAQLDQLVAATDHGCSSNSDCTIVGPPIDCPAWQCAGAALTHDGVSEVAPGFAAIKDGVCTAFGDAGCWSMWPIADCATPAPAACLQGQCVDCAVEDCSSVSCDACDTPEITWAPTGPMIGDAHTIVACKTLVTTFADSSPQCTTELPCAGGLRGDGLSMAHLQNLLGDPDVEAALAADANFGALTPAGLGVRVTIGAHAIFMSSAACGGAQNCTKPPAAVVSLFALLESLVIAQSCEPGAVRSAVCDLPFDAGTGSASLTVYAFDAAVGTCLPVTYTGAGGNENRFDTFESCQAQCPTTAGPDSCASDRTNVSDICLACGVGGGCVPTSNVCMLHCTSNGDCTDPNFVTCGPNGICGRLPCI